MKGGIRYAPLLRALDGVPDETLYSVRRIRMYHVPALDSALENSAPDAMLPAWWVRQTMNEPKQAPVVAASIPLDASVTIQGEVESETPSIAIECADTPCYVCTVLGTGSGFARQIPDWDKVGTNGRPVYFIQSESNLLVKIGYGDPGRRLLTMRSGCPVPLRLVGIVPFGGEILEAVLHRFFHASRSHGEWFHLTTDLVLAIHDVRRHWYHENSSYPPVLAPADWKDEAI